MYENLLTPTQRRIMGVLSDGKRHTKAELEEAIGNEMNGGNVLSVHLSNLRRITRPKGENVLCVYSHGRFYYQLVRLLGSQAR